MTEIFGMPVSKANMPDEVKEILDCKGQVVKVASWSLGTPDGETNSDFWKVVIYDQPSELFYIYTFCYYWEFDLTKCEKSMTTLSRDDMLAFVGMTQAYGEPVKQKQGVA